jgi:transposase
MMGVQAVAARLFYDFCLDDHVPADHQLRGIDRHLKLDDVRNGLKPFYSNTGRPSVDPELMIRMLLIGYCMGIRSERRLCEEVHLNLASRWQDSRSFDIFEEPARAFSREQCSAASVRDRRRALHG